MSGINNSLQTESGSCEFGSNASVSACDLWARSSTDPPAVLSYPLPRVSYWSPPQCWRESSPLCHFRCGCHGCSPSTFRRDVAPAPSNNWSLCNQLFHSSKMDLIMVNTIGINAQNIFIGNLMSGFMFISQQPNVRYMSQTPLIKSFLAMNIYMVCSVNYYII